MSGMLNAIRSGVEALLWPFDQLPPWIGLTLVSLLSGIGMLWFFGKTTPQRLVGLSRERMTAAIYEMRLFLDSPRRVLASTGRMLAWTGSYVITMMPAFIVLALPMGLLLLHMEPRYGLDPLPTGKDLFVLVQVDLTENADGDALEIADTEHLKVLAGPLYAADEHRAFFNLHVVDPGEHLLKLKLGEHTVEKLVSAEPGQIVAPTKASGAALLWTIGAEAPVDPASGIEAISIPHPDTERRWLGMPWWGYWLLVAMLAAIALRKTFNVTF